MSIIINFYDYDDNRNILANVNNLPINDRVIDPVRPEKNIITLRWSRGDFLRPPPSNNTYIKQVHQTNQVYQTKPNNTITST